MAATLRPVSEIVPGDIIDLESDRFADPDHDNPVFQCEYVMVTEVVKETPDCTVLYIDGVDGFGFPPEHKVRFWKHDDNFERE